MCGQKSWRMADLHIASCVARVRPQSLDTAIPLIEAVIGSAISARDGDGGRGGKLVIVLEGASTGALLDQMDEIRNIGRNPNRYWPLDSQLLFLLYCNRSGDLHTQMFVSPELPST